MSGVKADSNGWGVDANGNNMIGSGICLVGIRGTSIASNLVTRYNRMYGLVIGDNATGITVDGAFLERMVRTGVTMEAVYSFILMPCLIPTSRSREMSSLTAMPPRDLDWRAVCNIGY